jgi:hypothetical protein
MNFTSRRKTTATDDRFIGSRGLCAVVTTAMLLCNGPLTMAADAQTTTQGGQTAHPKKTYAPRKAVPAKSAQGIQVFGRWVIDVRNRDGSVAEHRAFENTVTNLGNDLLIALLAGQAVGGAPSLLATSAQAQPPCSNGCSISPTVSVSATSFQGNTMVVSGQTTATQDGVIDLVESGFVGCFVQNPALTPGAPITDASPSMCNGLTPAGSVIYYTYPFEFTQAKVSSISVSSGQTIQISVSITFASLG